MFRSKIRLMFTALVAAAAIAGLSSLWAIEASARPSQPAVVDQGYAALPDAATSGLGVSLAPLTTADQVLALLPVSQVVDLAKTSVGDVVNEASSITVSVGRFTDSEYGNTDDAGILHLVAVDVPAFVINFSGLSIPSLGGTTATDSQQAVVINALTGQVIETYTYP